MIEHEITLFSDAKAKNDKFGITDKNGNPVWYGKFFDDKNYNGEQSSGELAAALKAVWLASKIKEKSGIAETIRLNLFVDAEWLTYANNVGAGIKGGGKARKLGEQAKYYGLDLMVYWVSGDSNPADKYTVDAGFKKWQENDLSKLIIKTKGE